LVAILACVLGSGCVSLQPVEDQVSTGKVAVEKAKGIADVWEGAEDRLNQVVGVDTTIP